MAHGDTGRLEVRETTPIDNDSWIYVVRLTYANDGDPIDDATITVTVEDLPDRTMTPEGDGIYTVTIDFPRRGTHDVVFRVTEPEAELTVAQEVDAPAETTTTTTTPTTTPGVEETTTTVGVAPSLPEVDDDPNGTWLLLLMGVIVVLMVVLAVAFFRGRRRPPAPPSPPAPPAR